ncbi:MAG: hypothetical protein Q7S08_02700, partial [bacterium]|nr:hypothetical protein [bacterium]
ISISALILAIADMLFNWSVDNTILLFSSAVFDRVKDGVNAGWTAMRDIANIVIIGMFTFIAISTILGIQEYGAKKLLARVLIIAVLINFSLLFTKIIIDTSNFTAGQFYASATNTPLSKARDEAEARSKGAVVTVSDNNSSMFSFKKLGISGAFIRFLGVTSVSDTYKGLDDIANKGGGWYVALAHGLLAAVLLGGAGLVLFYGVYLLISRAVLFIFLMITAAGAFATHLIPKMNDSEYGWNGWWSSLLHNAALAPILMVLLYITLKVSESIAAKGSGTLGNLASPTIAGTNAGSDIGALFSYLIILGLLWGSFLLASKWASKVGGLGFTGKILGSAAVAPFALASRFIAAPIARKYIGGDAAARSMALDAKLKKESMRASMFGEGTREYNQALERITALQKQKDRADWRAKGSYNAANLSLAQKGMKGLGVPSFLSGAAKSEGYAGTAKARAEKAIKGAETLVLKKEGVKKDAGDDIRANLMRDPVFAEGLRKFRNAARDLRATADATRANRDNQSQTLEERRNNAQTAKATAEERLATANQSREVAIPLLVKLKVDKGNADAIVQQEEANATGMSGPELVAQQVKIEAARANANSIQTRVAAQQSEVTTLNQQARASSTAATQAANTIKETQDTIAGLNKAVESAEKEAREAERKGEEERIGEVEAIAKAVDKEAQEIVNRSKGFAVDAATRNVHRRYANLPNVWLGQTEESDTLSNITRKMAGSSAGIQYKDFRDAMSAVQDQLGTTATPVAAPAAPAAAPPATPHP